MRDLYGRDFQAGEVGCPVELFFIQASGVGFGQSVIPVEEARLLQERLRLFIQKHTVEDSDVVPV